MKRLDTACRFAVLVGLIAAEARAISLSIANEDSPGAVKIVLGNAVANVYVDAKDSKLVNIAGGLVADDVERVTGKKPNVVNDPAKLGANAIIIGSIGHSELVDQLIAAGKLDVSDIKGKWETYKLQVVEKPLPNVESALVIVGSDRRGTAYGVFALSEAIGVSPWYWWADVTPAHRDAIVVKPAIVKDGPPSVKYRGIFINDEDWGMQPWAAKTFDPQQKDIGPKTYEKVFELMLRLKANYIWPAMHECTIEFGKIDGNITLADEWGMAAGASHPEGMNRNNVDWPKLNLGEWRYDTNRDRVMSFWEEWAKKRGPFEAVWTLGMRGVHDAPMIGPPDMASKVKLLEQAINDQRELLRKYSNPDIEKTAQIFCPYKEALEQYRAGLKVPDDVTIVWTEDNYGYIRQLSNPDEQKRPGGSGVYYHISYLGSPFSYVWLNTTPPALIWEEMSKAYAYGADRVWMLNVGDIKPGEIGTDFFMRLAWDINSYSRTSVPDFLGEWATPIFGQEIAPRIADVMDKYYRLGFARKPESMNPNVFSVVNHREADRRLSDYRALVQAAEGIASEIAPNRRDAYFESVLYPVRMAALTNEAMICAGFSRRYTQESQLALANIYATRSENAVAKINSETEYFNNELAGGKWKFFMTAKGTTSQRWGFQWPQVQRAAGAPQPTAEHAALAGAFATPPEEPVSPRNSAGYVSIEAEHFTRSVAHSGARWEVIPGLGRTGDSVAVYPVTVASIDKPEQIIAQSPCMEYEITASESDSAKVTAYCLPTRRINATRGLRYAIAIDDASPQIVDFNQPTEGPIWSQNVQRNAAITTTTHKIASAGKHTLKIWMVDPGVVMDKIVMDLGGVKETYLGPPE